MPDVSKMRSVEVYRKETCHFVVKEVFVGGLTKEASLRIPNMPEYSYNSVYPIKYLALQGCFFCISLFVPRLSDYLVSVHPSLYPSKNLSIDFNLHPTKNKLFSPSSLSGINAGYSQLKPTQWLSQRTLSENWEGRKKVLIGLFQLFFTNRKLGLTFGGVGFVTIFFLRGREWVKYRK